MVGSTGRWGLCWGVNRHWGEGWPRPQPHRGNVRTSRLANLLNIGMGGPPTWQDCIPREGRQPLMLKSPTIIGIPPRRPPILLCQTLLAPIVCSVVARCCRCRCAKTCQISHFFEQVSNTDGPPSRWVPEPPVPPSGGMQLEEPRPPLFISGWREKMQAAEGPSRKGQRRGCHKTGRQRVLLSLWGRVPVARERGQILQQSMRRIRPTMPSHLLTRGG